MAAALAALAVTSAQASSIGGGQRAAVAQANLPDHTLASNAETDAACLAHKTGSPYATGWEACAAFETAQAARVTAAEAAIAASTTNWYTRALARLAMPP